MLIKRYLDDDVVTAARKRIKSMFGSGIQIVLCFSGGKDSIVLADITYKLLMRGEISASQLSVEFIDEEGMFEDVIDIVKKWRIKFMEAGVPFTWYCLPVKHFNCLNTLSEEETFICWEPNEEANWIREKPAFAVSDHPLLIPRVDNYQAFLARLRNFDHKVQMTGVRCSESVQRLRAFSKQADFISNNMCKPIYDMTDSDVWLYIYKNDLEIPEAYENMFRTGATKRDLRISQFFSIDTAKHLVNMSEMYPGLMERIMKREPNAYLCAMYWDTEMFGRSSAKRKELEGESKIDYREKLYALIKNPALLETDAQRDILKRFKRIIVSDGESLSMKIYKKMYECIYAGDPKSRTQRAIMESALNELRMSVQQQKRKGEI